MRGAVARPSRRPRPAMVVAVTFVVAPGREAPFSGVKTGRAGRLGRAADSKRLGAWTRAAALCSEGAGRAVARHARALRAAGARRGSGRDVAGGRVPGLAVLALLQAPPPWAPALRAIAGAGTGLALVAGLQALGVDPFCWLGWAGKHPGERMRILRHARQPGLRGRVPRRQPLRDRGRGGLRRSAPGPASDGHRRRRAPTRRAGRGALRARCSRWEPRLRAAGAAVPFQRQCPSG